MWNAYVRLFDGNSVYWFFFCSCGMCATIFSLPTLFVMTTSTILFRAMQYESYGTNRTNIKIPKKIFVRCEAFMPNAGLYDFIRHILLRNYIIQTDNWHICFNIHTPFTYAHTHTRILLAVRHLVWELLKWFQMNERRFDPLQLIVYTFTHTHTDVLLFVSFTHFIFSELRTQNTWGISFWGQWVNILRVILSFALHLVRKLMVLL